MPAVSALQPEGLLTLKSHRGDYRGQRGIVGEARRQSLRFHAGDHRSSLTANEQGGDR
jgi:hypothetical protein